MPMHPSPEPASSSFAPASEHADTPVAGSWMRSRTAAQQQRLRLLRFAAAGATYGIGLLILALCAALGMLEWLRLLLIAGGFLLINLVFLGLFLSRANLRFEDPSLTLPQVVAASTMVPLILVSGARLDLVAVPFYSVLFVFAMLRLDRGELARVGAYILASYAGAVLLRLHWYAGSISPRTEAVTALLVVVSTLWFGSAASYISRLRSRLKETALRLEQLATRDSLTGLWNRRQIELLLAGEIQRALRSGAPLAVLLADVDHFKRVNDLFGHAAGDEVLRQVAAVIGSAVRAGAQVGRWGGEEFLIVLPDTTLGDALACATRLRETLASTPFGMPQACTVTASIGLAAWSGSEAFQALLSRADRAMYQAKSAGRNRVAMVDPS